MPRRWRGLVDDPPLLCTAASDTALISSRPEGREEGERRRERGGEGGERGGGGGGERGEGKEEREGEGEEGAKKSVSKQLKQHSADNQQQHF